MGAGIGIALLGTIGADYPHASWLLGGVLAVVGFGVWAYRFHTEDKQTAAPSL
jgi:hypothetical protein